MISKFVSKYITVLIFFFSSFSVIYFIVFVLNLSQCLLRLEIVWNITGTLDNTKYKMQYQIVDISYNTSSLIMGGSMVGLYSDFDGLLNFILNQITNRSLFFDQSLAQMLKKLLYLACFQPKWQHSRLLIWKFWRFLRKICLFYVKTKLATLAGKFFFRQINLSRSFGKKFQIYRWKSYRSRHFEFT